MIWFVFLAICRTCRERLEGDTLMAVQHQEEAVAGACAAEVSNLIPGMSSLSLVHIYVSSSPRSIMSFIISTCQSYKTLHS